MKITKTKLVEIIKEELKAVLAEEENPWREEPEDREEDRNPWEEEEPEEKEEEFSGPVWDEYFEAAKAYGATDEEAEEHAEKMTKNKEGLAATTAG